MSDTKWPTVDIEARGNLVLIEKKMVETLVELAQTTAVCWKQEWTEAASRLTTAQGELRMALEDVQRARGDLS